MNIANLGGEHSSVLLFIWIEDDMIRVIICGPRDFNDYKYLEKECHRIFKQLANEGFISHYIRKAEIEIINGCATGADTLGKKFAEGWNLGIKDFPAKWDDLSVIPCVIKYNKYNKPYNALAGRNRNEQMAKYASETPNGICIAIWRETPGTKNMIELAEKYGLRVFRI